MVSKPSRYTQDEFSQRDVDETAAKAEPADAAAPVEGAFTCPLCGGVMTGAHCKLMCGNCGYREDCSDLFPA
jgi:hypothetical protein